ncbi:GntR family transcriptional regulator [Bacillus coahuilensis p1.1.43]|uniref:GntR family transcriptional regulator n=1 Tax=Bacillus coahuilensis p1.1.43 TaxID=1150625 RepID=A0A147K6Q4_9BACI|nr:GntR family transcriptional regulator [Bacillus coahuilensis p1.1.43]
MERKVYLDIVKKLRDLITSEKLQAGDKIPSERELSERLQAGRSSVREALRALELLGLIETRRGEGTFLRDFRDHQLVPLLGMFILENEQARGDVLKTKVIIEEHLFQLFLAECLLEKKNMNVVLEANTIESLFQEMFSMVSNKLLYKIWVILKDYDLRGKQVNEEDVKPFKQALKGSDIASIRNEFAVLQKLS